MLMVSPLLHLGTTSAPQPDRPILEAPIFEDEKFYELLLDEAKEWWKEYNIKNPPTKTTILDTETGWSSYGCIGTGRKIMRHPLRHR